MFSGGVLPAQAEVDRTALSAGPLPWWRQQTLVLVAVLAALNLADLITTQLVLARGGSEGNPVMRPFVEGVWGAAAVKLTCLTVIALLARRCVGSVRVLRGLVAVVAWYGFVVAWNLLVLARS
jgi:hypothetical protein